MSYLSNHKILNNLKTELDTLSKQALPVQTRGVLENVLQQFDQLCDISSSETQESRLKALYHISQSLGLSLDLSKVLNQVMDAIIELTGAERGFLTLIDSAAGDLHLRAARNMERKNLNSDDMHVSRTIIQSVINSEESIVTTDAQNDPRFAGQESIIFHDLKSILCAPLRSNGIIIGVIYVENQTHSGAFTAMDLDLLNAFASQAAVAIENARLYTQTDKALAAHLRELEILSQIDRELNTELDLMRVLEITRRWATKGTNAEECWIGLSDKETGHIQLFAGPTDDTYPEPAPEVFVSISSKASPRVIISGLYSYLVVPLLHGDELQGSIVVISQPGFSLKAKEFLTRLASRAASAIANALFFQAAKQANESKSQFVSIVTHELRIPLTSIKGYTDLIRQGAVGEVNQQQLSFLEVVNNNVERMSRLISDLSDISRIERGKLHLEPDSLHLQTYINETISSLRYKVEEKNQSLTAKVPSNLPNIHADPNRLVQVLTNLVSNAWKYTPEGGKIVVNAMQRNGCVQVEVIDDGIGISVNDQNKLFTQFFRSEAQEVREQTGWGLGLNVTKKLVEIMGGEIGFKSVLEEGSKFWFTVPVAEKQAW